MAALLALVALAPAARAQPAVATEADGVRRVVRVVVSGTEADASALEASLRELLGRVGLRLESSRVERVDPSDTATLEAPSSALAVAWIDLNTPDRATAVIVEGRSGRVVVRRDVARDRSSSIVVEEIAHIVHGSVEELADAERGREKPPPPPPPAEEPKPAPPPPARTEPGARPKWGLDLGGFFGGRAFGKDATSVIGGGGLVGGALSRGPLRPALWLSGAYHVAFDVPGSLVDLHTKALVLRVAPTLRVVGGDRWMIEAGPQVGMDVFWTTPEAAGLPAGRLEEESAHASPAVGALVAAHFGIDANADLFVAATADVDLAPHRYVVAIGRDSSEVFTPWRVRPALLFGFTFTFAGSGAYAQQEVTR